MKKVSVKKIIRQRKENFLVAKKNIRQKNSDAIYTKWVKAHCQMSILLPSHIYLYKSEIRGSLLNSLKRIPDTNSFTKPIALDFKNVKRLDAVSTNYFVHMLNKYSHIPMKGRVSKNNTVRSMLTKLKIHETLGMPEYFCKQQKVNKWLMARGTSSDLIGGYEVIEKALLEKFGETENFYVINEAISEAVNNVIDHAYDVNDIHREWLIFLAIESEECSVVISDLGKTIPVSLPETIQDSFEMGVTNVLTSLRDMDFENWQQIDDAKRIQLASLYRRTETKDKHRGKGFANMMEVCKQVPEAQLYVYSRKGLWMMKHGSEDRMQAFKSAIKGTIIYWSIPTGQSLSENLRNLAA